MKLFKITSAAGVDMGHYQGETEHEALDAMARDAGYVDQADAEAQTAQVFEGTVEEVSGGTYSIIRRSRNSRSLVTGLGEIVGVGNEGLDLYDALVERDARNLLRPEGSDSWDIEPAPPEDWRDRVGSDIEPSAVAAYMVEVLGEDESVAERLVA